MNIVIVDDDALVSGALKTILEADDQIHVLACGGDGTDAIKLYDTCKPDVLLMDIRMKEMNGLCASKQILSNHPEAKILLLTTFSDDEYIIRALKAGVKGYLLKQDYSSLIPAIKSIHTGQTVFGTEIISKIPSLLQEKSTIDYAAFDIGEKEHEIITYVAEGFSNKEIAEKMFLSEGTVRNYLSNVLDKLELRDRTQLAIFYYQHR